MSLSARVRRGSRGTRTGQALGRGRGLADLGRIGASPTIPYTNRKPVAATLRRTARGPVPARAGLAWMKLTLLTVSTGVHLRRLVLLGMA